MKLYGILGTYCFDLGILLVKFTVFFSLKVLVLLSMQDVVTAMFSVFKKELYINTK